jgi:hypothetical protein
MAPGLGRCWCSSTPQNLRPGQLAAHIALGITWAGLVDVGGRAHRKGQLRVLGSPSPRSAILPPGLGGHRGGGGSTDAIFFAIAP